MTHPLHISMAVDRGFEVPLTVALVSMAEVHAKSGVDCTVAVLYSGLDRETCQTIEKDVGGRIKLDWIEMDLAKFTGASYTVGLSAAALFRILLPEILPSTVERTIYVDADTLIRKPLSELARIDLRGNVVGAVRDAGAPFAAGPSGTDWRSLGLEPDMPYFNSGMMIFALDAWRKNGLAQKTLDLLRARKMPWGDQDALNIAVLGKWLELARSWNLQTADAEGSSFSWALWRSEVEAAVSDPAIIHYTEHLKPWSGRRNHPFADVWFDTLAKTSWAGWEKPRAHPLVRVGRRFTRALNVLANG